MLIAMAVIASFVSLASGIAAVGDGTRFDYKPKDILLGRLDALLYIWVVASTIFTLAHFTTLLQYGIENHFVVPVYSSPKWPWLHTSISTLLTAAHVFVRHELLDPAKRVTYLWGPQKSHDPDQ